MFAGTNSTMKKILLLFFFLCFFICLYSCKKDAGPLPESPVNCSAKGKVIIQVGAGGNTFSPSQVDAKVGDTIIWKYQSGYHSVTSNGIPAGAIAFDKDPMSSAADSLVYVLQIIGAYNYICNYHSTMTGIINVCQ